MTERPLHPRRLPPVFLPDTVIYNDRFCSAAVTDYGCFKYQLLLIIAIADSVTAGGCCIIWRLPFVFQNFRIPDLLDLLARSLNLLSRIYGKKFRKTLKAPRQQIKISQYFKRGTGSRRGDAAEREPILRFCLSKTVFSLPGNGFSPLGRPFAAQDKGANRFR